MISRPITLLLRFHFHAVFNTVLDESPVGARRLQSHQHIRGRIETWRGNSIVIFDCLEAL